MSPGDSACLSSELDGGLSALGPSPAALQVELSFAGVEAAYGRRNTV